MGTGPQPPGDDTRWLDDDEQATWRAFWLASRALAAAFERDLQRDSGLAMTYYEILVQLSEAPERMMRMSELARLSHVSRSALSHGVARLEANGWVERRDCPDDRRGSLAVLTDEGFAVLAAAAPAHVTSVRRHLFDQLTPEDLDHLGRISDLLLDHLRTEGSAPMAGDASVTAPG
jgi:DNA-binding MarR family transcriptional regulator